MEIQTGLIMIIIMLAMVTYLLWDIRKILLKSYEETERLSQNFYDYYLETVPDKD